MARPGLRTARGDEPELREELKATGVRGSHAPRFVLALATANVVSEGRDGQPRKTASRRRPRRRSGLSHGDDRMTRDPTTRYRIEGEIGRGGMATVYPSARGEPPSPSHSNGSRPRVVPAFDVAEDRHASIHMAPEGAAVHRWSGPVASKVRSGRSPLSQAMNDPSSPVHIHFTPHRADSWRTVGA